MELTVLTLGSAWQSLHQVSCGPSWATEPWTNSNRLICPPQAMYSGGTGPEQPHRTLHSEREKWKPAGGTDWCVMFLKLFLGKYQKGLFPRQGGWKKSIDSLDSPLWRVFFCCHHWPCIQWVYALSSCATCTMLGDYKSRGVVIPLTVNLSQNYLVSFLSLISVNCNCLYCYSSFQSMVLRSTIFFCLLAPFSLSPLTGMYLSLLPVQVPWVNMRLYFSVGKLHFYFDLSEALYHCIS